MEKNSALYWLPKISEIHGIHIPMTKIVEIRPEDMYELCSDLDLFKKDYGESIEGAFDSFDFPIFVKTDELAGKHDWKDTCFVETKDDFYTHLQNLGWCCRMVDVPLRAILIREYLELETVFTFFHGEMPVAKERRYFVNDGIVRCHHPYWDEMVFRDSFEMDDSTAEMLERDPKISPRERKMMMDDLRSINEETEEEIKLLTTMATKIGSVLDGAWSIDFACDVNGKWWTIDLALAFDSWHPKECPYYDELSDKAKIFSNFKSEAQ